MKLRDLADLLSRARARIEDPESLNEQETNELVEDLAAAEEEIRGE